MSSMFVLFLFHSSFLSIEYDTQLRTDRPFCRIASNSFLFKTSTRREFIDTGHNSSLNHFCKLSFCFFLLLRAFALIVKYRESTFFFVQKSHQKEEAKKTKMDQCTSDNFNNYMKSRKEKKLVQDLKHAIN